MGCKTGACGGRTFSGSWGPRVGSCRLPWAQEGLVQPPYCGAAAAGGSGPVTERGHRARLCSSVGPPGQLAALTDAPEWGALALPWPRPGCRGCILHGPVGRPSSEPRPPPGETVWSLAERTPPAARPWGRHPQTCRKRGEGCGWSHGARPSEPNPAGAGSSAQRQAPGPPPALTRRPGSSVQGPRLVVNPPPEGISH